MTALSHVQKWTQSLRPRELDLNTQFNGSAVYLVDGDSLLLNCLKDPLRKQLVVIVGKKSCSGDNYPSSDLHFPDLTLLVDWQHGGQFLHSIYLVEKVFQVG